MKKPPNSLEDTFELKEKIEKKTQETEKEMKQKLDDVEKKIAEIKETNQFFTQNLGKSKNIYQT